MISNVIFKIYKYHHVWRNIICLKEILYKINIFFNNCKVHYRPKKWTLCNYGSPWFTSSLFLLTCLPCWHLSLTMAVLLISGEMADPPQTWLTLWLCWAENKTKMTSKKPFMYLLFLHLQVISKYHENNSVVL